ncbi:MAG: amidohydrolase, partial [Gemmatimonadaceae bacterium]
MRPHFAMILCLAACSARARSAESAGGPVAITHVTVIDVAATNASVARKSGQTVVIDGDEIRNVGPDSSVTVPSGATIIDGSGKYLIPGLWDAHAHLTEGGRGALEMLVANGVTGARDLGGRFGELQQLRSDIRAGQLTGPLLVL